MVNQNWKKISDAGFSVLITSSRSGIARAHLLDAAGSKIRCSLQTFRSVGGVDLVETETFKFVEFRDNKTTSSVLSQKMPSARHDSHLGRALEKLAPFVSVNAQVSGKERLVNAVS